MREFVGRDSDAEKLVRSTVATRLALGDVAELALHEGIDDGNGQLSASSFVNSRPH